jgi:hypothetical protein
LGSELQQEKKLQQDKDSTVQKLLQKQTSSRLLKQIAEKEAAAVRVTARRECVLQQTFCRCTPFHSRPATPHCTFVVLIATLPLLACYFVWFGRSERLWLAVLFLA